MGGCGRLVAANVRAWAVLVAVLVLSAAIAGCGGSGRPSYETLCATAKANGVACSVPDAFAAADLPKEAGPGAALFVASGCLICHTYLGQGSSELGAPDLTEEGNRGRGLQWQIDHLTEPARLVPNSPMPSYRTTGRDLLTALAVFLEASKGRR